MGFFVPLFRVRARVLSCLRINGHIGDRLVVYMLIPRARALSSTSADASSDNAQVLREYVVGRERSGEGGTECASERGITKLILIANVFKSFLSTSEHTQTHTHIYAAICERVCVCGVDRPQTGPD